mgnify:CR=1 FL=1
MILIEAWNEWGEGSISNGSNDDFIAVRYNVDGSLDASFGTGGVASVEIGQPRELTLLLGLGRAGGERDGHLPCSQHSHWC